MNVKAVKDSFEKLLAGGWLGDKTNSKSVVPNFGSDRVVEVNDYYALLDSTAFNCPLIRKEDGIIEGCDRLFEPLENIIKEFTPEEFENFLETELKRVSQYRGSYLAKR